jgi:hypothetical protein
LDHLFNARDDPPNFSVLDCEVENCLACSV